MKRMSLMVALFFVLSLSITTLFAAETIELGIPLPLTGGQAKFGEMEKRSYEMAAEEINAKGGIKGKKIKLSFEDSQGKPEISRAIAEKLIDVKKRAESNRRSLYFEALQKCDFGANTFSCLKIRRNVRINCAEYRRGFCATYN